MARRGRKVGEAFIEVRPETTGFTSDVRRTAQRTARTVSTDIPVDADARGLRRQVTTAARRASAGQRIRVPVTADTRAANRNILGFRRNIRGLNAEVQDARQASEGLQFPGMAAAALLAAGAFQAMTGATAGLAAALAPVAGLVGTLPGLLVAGGQAAGTAALAFGGVGDAIGALAEQQTASAEEAEAAAEAAEEAMGGLTPAAQRFARTIAGTRDELTALRATAQESLLPGVESGFRSALRLLPAMDGAIQRTGQSLGRTLERLGSFFGSAGFSRDFTSVTRAGALALDDLGGAAVSVTRGFFDIAVAAEPLTRWLTRLVRGAAQSFEIFASTGRESGRLARIFNAAREATQQWGRLLGNLGGTLSNTLGAAFESGTALLGTLISLTGQLREMTGSAEGQEALRRFFADSAELGERLGPVLADVALRMGEVFASLVRLSNGFLSLLEASPILRQLATDAIAFSLALNFLTRLAPIGRALAFFRVTVAALSTAKRAYVAVTNLAIVASARERAAALASAAATRAHAAATTVFSRATLAQTQLLAGLTLASIRHRAATIASTAATVASTAAARAAAVAQGALNVVLSLNPIGLVVAALVALGVAFVTAYKRSETFRRIVDGVWRWLRNTASAVGRWVVDRFTSAWNAVVAGARRMAAGIRRAIEPIRNIISGITSTASRVGSALRIPGFQRGGRVRGHGRGDRVPALLEPGELVVPNRTRDVRRLLREPATRARLASTAQAAAGVQRFQTGGIVAPTSRLAVAGSGAEETTPTQLVRTLAAAVEAGVAAAMDDARELRLVVTDRAGRALFEAVERERARRQRSLGAVTG